MQIYRLKTRLFITVAAATVSWFGLAGLAHATYHANRLIDDAKFVDSDSMSRDEIQNFLAGKNSYLKNHSYKEVCSNSYMTARYAHCGKTVSAATIIYDAGKAWGLSPRTIMATMQKEESLITDPDPAQSQVDFAMGYGCPDSGGCGSVRGFFNQTDNGTWQLRYNYEAVQGRNFTGVPASSYVCDHATGFYSGGLFPGRKVTFYSTSGHPDVRFTIYNAATASLYCYTPHVGPFSQTGYSGSYNFVTSYESWWGSTIYDSTKDKVLVGDWDGDGKQTPAIHRGNSFYFDNNDDGYIDDAGDTSFAWGKPTDQVFVGNWNGSNDGIALKRGNQYFLDYDNNGHSDKYLQWGKASDQVIVGNWYGSSGAGDKLGLKRGNQYFLDWNNDAHSDASYAWGKTTDQVMVGAWYNSNSQDKLGLKRGNLYFLDYDNNGQSNQSYAWGKTTDKVLVGNWYGSSNGRDMLGLRRDNQYFLDWNNNGQSDVSYTWGNADDRLLIGDWYGSSVGKDKLGLKRSSNFFLDYDNNHASDSSYVYTY